MPTRTCQLATIMFTDTVGYTALMQGGEQKAIFMLKRHQEVLEKNINIHQGNVFLYHGDGSLSILTGATEALHCAIGIHKIQLILEADLK